jgi:hypothetical protein
MEPSMHWAEAWLRTTTSTWRPRLKASTRHRDRASVISEQTVMIGVIATLGLSAVAAFMTGLDKILTRELALIGGQVP